MKKTSILIAMFTVIATASVVCAENIINFDGKGTSRGSFADLLQTAGSCQDNAPACSIPSPVAVKSETEETPHVTAGPDKFYRLKAAAIEKFRAAALHSTLVNGIDHKVSQMISDRNTEVLFSGRRTLFVQISGQDKYTAIGETDNKNLLTFLKDLDSAEKSQATAANSNKLYCAKPRWVEQCKNKKILETVCELGTLANGTIGTICSQVVKWIPECWQVMECDEWGW